MNKNLTEMVFIIDRSGSMGGLEKDTIGGFNAMIEKQKKEEGSANVTTVLFDDKYEILHDRINIAGVEPITDKDYFVRGCTALLDAIGITVAKISNAVNHTAESEKPAHVIFTIITDGMENSSREYDQKRISSMIEDRKKDGWEFVFIGANIDAVTVASSIGIERNNAVNYKADSKGTSKVYESINCMASRVRDNRPIGKQWRKELDEDFNKRK